MNKAEIIRKISKKAGVPDTEAKKFFEIFLKNASDILKPGESLDIAGVGVFQLRVGQIEHSGSQLPDEKYIYSDLIVYINKAASLEDDEEIIFNVPSGIEKEYQPYDSYFSLSIGKPVIPLKGVKETEFFIPPSGTELRSLLESKIERLISQAKKTEGGKETETISLKDEKENTRNLAGRIDRDDDNVQDETEVPDRSDFLKTREFENLSWDFGENLSGEITEDSGSEYKSDPEEKIPEDKFPEYKPKETQSAEIKPEFEEEREEVREEDIFEDVIDEDEGENVYFEDEDEELKDSLDNEKDEGEISGSFIPESPVPEEQANPEQESVMPEEPLLKNFQRVRSLTKEFTTTEFDDYRESDHEEDKPKRVTEVRGGYQKVRRTTAEFNFDLSGIKGLDEIDEEPPVKEKKGDRDYQGYRKRGSVPTLIISLVVVIALAGILFLYFKLKSANGQVPEESACG